MHLRLITAFALVSAPLAAQSVRVPFNNDFHIRLVGQTPQSSSYAGIAFAPNNANVLLSSPYQSQNIYANGLTRNGAGEITGIGAGTSVATVAQTDGGLAFEPGGTLFFTGYPGNQLGQIPPGQSVPAVVTDLTTVGVAGSVGGCTFVPAGLPGAGQLKVVSYNSGNWYTVPLTPASGGTFTVGTASAPISLGSGLEGAVYVPAGVPQIGGQVLVANWSRGEVSAYQIDANGDPIPATKAVVIGSLAGAAGGAVDPVTGNILFSSNGGGIWELASGTVCGTFGNYGQPSPGAGATPTIAGSGCPRLGQSVTITCSGDPGGFGLMTFSQSEANAIWNGTLVLTFFDFTLAHQLDANGQWSLPIQIPNNTTLGFRNFYMQCAYLDASTQSGLKASDGLVMQIR